MINFVQLNLDININADTNITTFSTNDLVNLQKS